MKLLEVPAPLDRVPLAPSSGVVNDTLVVEWSLPPSVVVPNEILHLGIYSESPDGVDYARVGSDAAPALLVAVP